MNIKQGLAPIVLIIVVAVLLGGGYVVVYKWFDYSFSTDNPPNPIRAEDIGNATKLTRNISDWKTYRNEKYGFEFQYPSEWHSRLYEVVQVSAPVSSSSFIVNSAGPTTSIIIHDDGRRRIDVGTNAVISGRKAIDGGWKVGVGNYISRIIIIDESPLSIDMGATSEKDKATEEQILSTFKFTK